MFQGNMCVGVVNEELMVRVGPNAYEEALAQPHARKMDFTGKPMKGFVYVKISRPGSTAAWPSRPHCRRSE